MATETPSRNDDDTLTRPTGHDQGDQTGRTMQVLVVEDDPACRRSLTRTLKLAGFAVDGAKDGQEALELFGQNGADIIVTDLLMPNMDGIDLILNLRFDRPELPVIAITGSTQKDMHDAHTFGAHRVLAKPVEGEQLARTIREVLANPVRPAT